MNMAEQWYYESAKNIGSPLPGFSRTDASRPMTTRVSTPIKSGAFPFRAKEFAYDHKNIGHMPSASNYLNKKPNVPFKSSPSFHGSGLAKR